MKFKLRSVATSTGVLLPREMLLRLKVKKAWIRGNMKATSR